MMTDFVNTIDVLGDAAVVKALVDKTITEFNDDVVTVVGKRAFYECAELTTVNMPNVGEIDQKALQDCGNLVSAYFQKATLIREYAMDGCEKLSTVDISSAASIYSDAFEDCKSLTMLDMPRVTSIGSKVFRGCSVLNTIILRSEKVCALGNANTFDSTPFSWSSKGGTAYVPQALIEQYQTATNWSTLYAAGTCNFVAIEGSEYE